MTEECIFCKIASGELPNDLLYKDEKIVAFTDIDPKAPVHILIIPRQHISTLNDLDNSQKELIGHIVFTASKLAAECGIAESGYRVLLNCNKEGGQAVYHIHLHLLGGRAMLWPPG